MTAALEAGPGCCAEAARRKRISVGSARGVYIGSRYRTDGLDLEGDACGVAQATNSNQQERVVAFFHQAQHHLEKKLYKPRNDSERTWPARADVGCESKACLIPPGWCLSTRLRSAPTWRGSGAALHGAPG